MPKQTSAFANQIVASGLVNSEQLSECIRLLGDQATDDRLADLLLHRKLLTKWQLKQLQGGKSCTFFLGQYLLLEPIGSGGMGRVFQALDTNVGRQVAIKLLREGRATPKAIERLRREGQAALVLQHENIVRTFELGQQAETHFWSWNWSRELTWQSILPSTASSRPRRRRGSAMRSRWLLTMRGKMG